ncbi:MAG: segregation/condensation protein A [Cellulosilyticum sp.]|nr:segregation/condensation protein A [Cellulosilyticum sp.]
MTVTFKLQDFEGPLDLLLYLIEKNKMNIYDIEISSITDQYMEYLEAATEVELDQMSDFIVMAATLLYIKSRMLLPKPNKVGEEPEEDPREELVRKLLEYKKVKYVSEKLSECQGESMQYCFRNKMAHLEIPDAPISYENILDNVSLKLLYDTFEQLMKQKEWDDKQQNERQIDQRILKKDTYTIEQKSLYIRELIALKGETTFFSICNGQMPKVELIVTFMALLELIHKKEICVEQETPTSDIFIKEAM